MKSMTTSSSSSSKASFSPHCPSHFTPIVEGNEEDEFPNSFRGSDYEHYPTPLHSDAKGSYKNRPETDVSAGVLCNKCRPSNREKFSVVPLENNRVAAASPNGIFKSFFGSLSMKKSPFSSDGGSVVSREEQWKAVVSELSNKLVNASRKRDEAIDETSKLKNSMAELEKKLNKLEIYCQSLKQGIEVCNNGNQHPKLNYSCIKIGDPQKVIQHFLIMVSESRSSVRVLSRALVLQMTQMGEKVHERLSLHLQPYAIKLSFLKNPRSSLVYLEALLNQVFYQDFESIGFQKNSTNPILNPIDHCESNFAMFNKLNQLSWEEVLSKGTKRFSEEFSKFCNRKMSDIVGMLGWNHAWPEPLLQAFFRASKAIWLVHLLANSVHPCLPIFRVDKGATFDSVYMEDMGGKKAAEVAAGATMIRMMVTPGFYVYDNVVKCKVICRYHHHRHHGCSGDEDEDK